MAEVKDLERCQSSVERIPLHHDPTLPQGWSRKVRERNIFTAILISGFQVFPRQGKVAWYTIITNPQGVRFRSRPELQRHFEKTGETTLCWQDFDFNPFGSSSKLAKVVTVAEE